MKGLVPRNELKHKVEKIASTLADELGCSTTDIPINDIFDLSGILSWQIAAQEGITVRELHKKLYDAGVIYKRGQTWYPYAKYINKGYGKYRHNGIKHNSGILSMNMLWTWTLKGYLFIKYVLRNKQDNKHKTSKNDGDMIQMTFNL